jgi:hypothetical protein
MAASLARHCGAAIALIVFATTSADAQVYVSAVWSIASRESATTTSSSAEATNVQSGTLLAGVHLTPRLALEGSFEIQQRQSFDWYYGYAIFGFPTFQHFTERDMPVAANLRFAVNCWRRVCLDLLAGGGFNRHNAMTQVYAVCTFANPAPPCEPVSPLPEERSQQSWEFMALGGFDAPIRISRHLAIGPTARFRLIHRTEELTYARFRGPRSGSGMVPSLGVAVTWRSR